MTRYIPLFNDLVFKYVFGSKEHVTVLCAFLNAILSPVLKHKIVEVNIENPFNLQEAWDEKLSILDIRATDETGKIYNLEMQVAEDHRYAQRALFYACRTHAQQLKSGDEYQNLTPVISISILNWIWKPSPKLHSVFRLMELSSYEEFPNYLEFHMIQLPFLEDTQEFSACSLLEKWLLFIAKGDDYMIQPNDKILEELLKEEGMADAFAAYQKCNASKELRNLIEAREKAQRDHLSRMNQAMEQGHERGLQQGIQEGLQQGLQQGLQRGELEGKLKILLMLYRNGTLSKEATVEQMQSLLGQNYDELVQSFLGQLQQ